jgi:hypothetical protein
LSVVVGHNGRFERLVVFRILQRPDDGCEWRASAQCNRF